MHLATAGTVDLVQRCHLGLETAGSGLRFHLCLPKDRLALRVRVRYRGQGLQVVSGDGALPVTSLAWAGPPIGGGEGREIAPGMTAKFGISCRYACPRARAGIYFICIALLSRRQ